MTNIVRCISRAASLLIDARDAVSSVYLWDRDNGFAGLILIKKKIKVNDGAALE